MKKPKKPEAARAKRVVRFETPVLIAKIPGANWPLMVDADQSWLRKKYAEDKGVVILPGTLIYEEPAAAKGKVKRA